MDARTEAIEEALRLAYSAVATTEGEGVPEIEPDGWRGPAASRAAEELSALGRELAVCRALAADYLSAARRAAADV